MPCPSAPEGAIQVPTELQTKYDSLERGRKHHERLQKKLEGKLGEAKAGGERAATKDDNGAAAGKKRASDDGAGESGGSVAKAAASVPQWRLERDARKKAKKQQQ